MFTLSLFLTLVSFTTSVKGHVSIWHPSMYGFNVTQQTFPYDNRPVAPLTDYTFEQWWFHGHLDHPPNPGDIFELPAGQTATTELGCNKGATSYFASSEGGDIRQGNAVCPNSPLSAIHTTGFQDLTGCALAIAYKSDAKQVQPEDFTVFSVNQTCVWTRFTDFQVPAKMPPCPEGGCTCAWFWIHSPDSGGEQNYMNGFKCNVTGSASNVALATPQLPRRCGIDLANERSVATLGNCTYGAKQPFYWFQKERNNMLEGTYSPPFYTDLYNFRDGAQNDIFVDSYSSIPIPSVNQTVIPMLLPIPSDTPVLSIPVPSLVSPLLYSETSSSGMPSPTMTPAPSVPASSVSCSTSTVNSQSPSPPGVQPSSMPSVVSSSSSLSPGVTVTTTVMVTVFANEPSSVPSSSVSNSVGSLPSPVQNDTTSVSIIELVAEPSSTSTFTSCKARNGTALRRRSTFASRLLRHRNQKRNYSLWHIF